MAMLGLVLGSGLASRQRFLDRMELFRVFSNQGRYAVEDAKTYGQLRLSLERPPEPLSLLAEGLGESYGSSALVAGRFGGLRLHARQRPEAFAGWDGDLDFSQMLALFMTLLAFLVSYDAICGDRESGVLQLVLSNSVPRWSHLLGNYLGCVLALGLPLTAALAICGLIMNRMAGVDLAGDNGWRFALFAAAALALVSASVWLGLACSAAARNSTTAFILAFAAWACFALVFPNLLAWASSLSGEAADRGLEPQGVIEYVRMTANGGPRGGDSEMRRRREWILNSRLAQAETAARWSVLSPAAAFLESARALAGTDCSSQAWFMREARRLNADLIRWQDAKLARYPERDWNFSNSWEPLDKEGLPAAEHRPLSLTRSLRRAAAPLAALGAFNLLFGLAALAAFVRYDVRSG